MEPDRQLQIISMAWGRQRGYCFFPWIKGDSADKRERVGNYHEGPAFFWPKDRARILGHLNDHANDDVYWCPSLFEKPQRKMELAMDEHALWADLDEVDPRDIDDYQPTIAWETSPGRYQALWVIAAGDIQGASWTGNENQRLTYYLGADVSGWDTTQLLRLPGGKNFKFDYWTEERKWVQGELLWRDGRQWFADSFEGLPEVVNTGVQMSEILEDEINRTDRHEVWGRVRLKVSGQVREFMAARDTTGADRSGVLWQIERDLADAGCSVVEIVAIVRGSIWNKFEGRSDELRRLTTEASKAFDLREIKRKDLEEGEEEKRPEPQLLFDRMKDVHPPVWLVKDILTQGACAIFAGHPKTYKSWLGLDLALSVATGKSFLDHFPVRREGPVLYLQEEDSAPMVKGRLNKIWPSKVNGKIKLGADGQPWFFPPDPAESPDINCMIREGIIISDPGWQSWLDEQLSKGFGEAGLEYVLVVVDTLMSTAGDVNENSSQEMNTKYFKPLRTLSEKHGCAVLIIHHMRKSQASDRGGQNMLGSTANHAFAEDALYISKEKGVLVVEFESKTAESGSFKIRDLWIKGWEPRVTDEKRGVAEEPPRERAGICKILEELGGSATVTQIAHRAHITRDGAYKQLMRALKKGELHRSNGAGRVQTWELFD